jgi:hypothetical protein
VTTNAAPKAIRSFDELKQRLRPKARKRGRPKVARPVLPMNAYADMDGRPSWLALAAILHLHKSRTVARVTTCCRDAL